MKNDISDVPEIDIRQEDIKIFLKTFSLLSDFEAGQRMNRGWGAFEEDEVTELGPVCKRVIGWLGTLDDNMISTLKKKLD